MVLNSIQTSSHCPFARLASSDCFFIGSRGCTLVPRDFNQQLFISYNECREDLLAKNGLSKGRGREIRGPFNRLLTIPHAALDHERGMDKAMVPTVVKTNAIGVSTPMYPSDLIAKLGICIAVIGTRTEEGAGVFNIMVHLIPTGHLKYALEPFHIGDLCCTSQFSSWASHWLSSSNQERKILFLTTMLNIFRSGGWNMTIATPAMNIGNGPNWINQADVKRHLTEGLGYDKNAIKVERAHNVKLASNGRIYLTR